MYVGRVFSGFVRKRSELRPRS